MPSPNRNPAEPTKPAKPPERTHCKRCGIEFEETNPPENCGICDGFTLCRLCAEDHACCITDEEVKARNLYEEHCIECKATTTLACGNCPHNPRPTQTIPPWGIAGA